MASRDGLGDTGIGRDFAAMRPLLWIPAVTTLVAVVVAIIAAGAFVSDSGDARFRSTIVVDALPPLFGPPLLPGPIEYASLATSDSVVAAVAVETGREQSEVAGRMSAVPRINTPQIDFRVTGPDALLIAEAWERAFTDAAGPATAGIQRDLMEPYVDQLEQARLQLVRAELEAEAGDAAAQQREAAARENYETASRLVQSYEVVAETMTAAAITSKAPHAYDGGLGSPTARIGAAAAIGLVSGLLAAAAVAWMRGRNDDDDADVGPPSIRRVEAQAGSGRR